MQGRTRASSGGIQFDHSAISFRFTVAGADSVVARLSQAGPDPAVVQPHYFKVFVDEVFQPGSSKDSSLGSTFSFGTSDALWREGPNGTVPLVDVVLATNLSIGATHEILVVKATEAQFCEILPTPNYMCLHGIELSAPAGSSTAPSLTAPAASPTRRLEFLGDSITAGYCNLCDVTPNATGAAVESAYDSWPRLIAQKAGVSVRAHEI
jgi:hypothetical protein